MAAIAATISGIHLDGMVTLRPVEANSERNNGERILPFASEKMPMDKIDGVSGCDTCNSSDQRANQEFYRPHMPYPAISV